MQTIKSMFYLLVVAYLRFAARLQLKKTHPKIIGIAGSSGKTSLDKLIFLVLKGSFNVLHSEGKNSEIGIPLTILGINMNNVTPKEWLKVLFLAKWNVLTNWKKYEVYVAEMGIDSPVPPKNMSYLLSIVQPTIGVVTNITAEHSVYFDPFVMIKNEEERKKEILSMTAKEEMQLLASLPVFGTAIVNLDDEEINKRKHEIQAKQITVSLYDAKASFYAQHIMIDTTQFAMEFVYQDKEYILRLSQPVPQHFAYEFLFTIAIGTVFGLSIEQIIQTIEEKFSTPPGRMTIFEGIKNTTIIDSSYNNATLSPILDMLEFLNKLGRKRRKMVIVGDMRELGSQSRENHEIVADKIAREADSAILIGPLMRNYAAPILEKKKFPFKSFLTFTEAKQYILDEVQEGDIILVKASQNTLFLERVVEMLLARKEDVSKLCRRGEFWDKKRKATA